MTYTNRRAMACGVAASAIAVIGLVVILRHRYGIEQRPVIGAFLNNRLPSRAIVQTGKWALVETYPNLEFEDPTSLLPVPRSNRLCVSSRQGRIEWFDNDPQVSQKNVLLDLGPVTQGWDDCGLLSFVFHPQFGDPNSANRGFIYVWYHYSPSPVDGPGRPPVNTPGYNRLSRFTVPDGAETADRDSEQVLINQFDHNVWHDGGGMFFGQDGFLYLGVSDEGGQRDYYGNSQTIRKRLFSGVLRIDVDCDPQRSHPIRRQPEEEYELPVSFTANSYTAHYFIPDDNPFLDSDGGVLEEFWAIGLRNPHRMTIDPATNQIWEGDVGEDKWEEVNVIERGRNYQWAYMEGKHVLSGARRPPPRSDLIEAPPVYEYAHGTDGNCIIGGYVYRGQQWTRELGGKYIFGDNGSGRIWSLKWNGESAPEIEYLCNMPPGSNYTGLSSFGIDQQGELYLCRMGRPSKILKLTLATDQTQSKFVSFTVPHHLSWVGAFADLKSLTLKQGCIPYDVNCPLWSDGAQKNRWIAVPENEQITFSPTGEWIFPDGTVFIKNFDIVINELTDEKRRLETRFLVRQQGGGVYGVSYKWHSDNRDADLVLNPVEEKILIVTENGIREQTWYFPGPSDCVSCHNPNSGGVLGVNCRQLNRNFEYSDATDNQIRTWSHIGLFAQKLDDGDFKKLSALVSVDDKSAPLEARVRSYIDANCSHCHRRDGAAGYFDARYDTPLDKQGLINGRLVKSLDIAEAKVVCPSEAANSMLYKRVGADGPLRMPPLASKVVDRKAQAVIHDWIESIAP